MERKPDSNLAANRPAALLQIGQQVGTRRCCDRTSGNVLAHPMMLPYGAPVPYPTLYSQPEVHAHPGTDMVIRQKVPSSSGTTVPLPKANLQNEKSGNPVDRMPATAGNPSRGEGIGLSNPSAGNVALEMQSNPSGAPQAVVPPPITGQWARSY